MAAGERLSLREAEDALTEAAAVHIAHRQGCPQARCPECVALGRAVLRLQAHVGALRFCQADDDELGAA